MKFSVKQNALAPYWRLHDAISTTGVSGGTFDLRLTPVKEEGKPDTLILELSRGTSGQAYGIAYISEGVEIEELGPSVLLSSKAFGAMPPSTSDMPLRFNISDRVVIDYPSDGVLSNTQFDFEYSSETMLFQAPTPVAPMFGFNKPGYTLLRGHLESAANYVEKKRLDNAMSAIRCCFSMGSLLIESTNGFEAFYSKITNSQLYACYQQQENPWICTLYPSLWFAGLQLVHKSESELYVGFDGNSITFTSSGISLTCRLMAFDNFPDIYPVINGWMQNPRYQSFNAKITPAVLREKLAFLERIALAARSEEPSFIFSNRGQRSQIRLKGPVSGGQAEIVDPNLLVIQWHKNEPLVLPARMLLNALTTAVEHGLNDFFDLEDAPSVFFTNADNSVLLLMSKEVPPGEATAEG